MDPVQPSSKDGKPVYSARERITALAILLLMAALIWILLEPPGWIRRLPASSYEGRSIPDPTKGSPDAPLKIIEYNDFACTACRTWHKSDIREKILEKYEGQVVFIWRDFPISSSFASRAAEAAQCANDQGRFWDYHDYLYENAEGFMDEKLVEYAGRLGLDVKKFDQCFIGGELRAKVLNSREAGYESGVRTAPTLVINGKLFVGPASLEGLGRVIDEALLSTASGQSEF